MIGRICYIWRPNKKLILMNLKRFKVAFAAILMVGTVFTACSGEDGADGTVGPAGANGNANVTNNTYTIASADWMAVFNANGQQTGAEARIPAASLTSTSVDQAGVLGYFSTDAAASKEWIAIPSGALLFRYKTDTAIVGMNSFGGLSADSYFKLVVIPPAAKVAGVNEVNFEEVQAVYGLSD